MKDLLGNNNSNFEALLKGVGEVVYRMSLPDGKYEYIFPDTKAVMGYESLNFFKNPLFIKEIIHPDFTSFFEKEWNALINGKISSSYEYKIIDPEGKERWILQSNLGIFNPEGKIIAIEGICRNITESKDLEQNLKKLVNQLKQKNVDLIEQEKREHALYEEWIKYKTLIEGLNEALFRMTIPDGIYEYVSPVFKDVTGYSREELFKNPLLIKKIMHPDSVEYFKEKFTDILKGILPETFEFKIIDPEGKERWILQSNKGVYDDKGNIIRLEGICRNITNQKKMEKELIISEKKFREAYNRANFYKDLFTHDIKNILQSILSAVELINFYKNSPENQNLLNKSIEIITEQIDRASKLVSNIQKISDIEESKIKIEKIDIIDVLNKSIKYLKITYLNKDIKILINSIAKFIYVQANVLIIEVFENILINAVKHNKNSIIEINTYITKFNQKGKNYYKLEFIDNGQGIEENRKIEIFQRADFDLKKVGGIGLGLSLVKKIIESYNGQIWVEDRVKGDYKKGSNFVILIPEIT